jgi:hypothetical protein
VDGIGTREIFSRDQILNLLRQFKGIAQRIKQRGPLIDARFG